MKEHQVGCSCPGEYLLSWSFVDRLKAGPEIPRGTRMYIRPNTCCCQNLILKHKKPFTPPCSCTTKARSTCHVSPLFVSACYGRLHHADVCCDSLKSLAEAQHSPTTATTSSNSTTSIVSTTSSISTTTNKPSTSPLQESCT